VDEDGLAEAQLCEDAHVEKVKNKVKKWRQNNK